MGTRPIFENTASSTGHTMSPSKKSKQRKKVLPIKNTARKKGKKAPAPTPVNTIRKVPWKEILLGSEEDEWLTGRI